MRRVPLIAAFSFLACAAGAQDTTVVIVRHIPPAPNAPVVRRAPAPAPYATRYDARYPNLFAKDPSVGTMLGLMIPGGGQYYAGAEGKGFALTLIGYGAPIAGFAAVYNDHRYYDNGYDCSTYGGPRLYGDSRCRRDWTPAAVGLGIGLTAWIYGFATAGTDVEHWNQQHGVRFVAAPGRVGFAVPWP